MRNGRDARYYREVTKRSAGRRPSKPRRVATRPTSAVDYVRSIAATLPRAYEAVVRGRVKFRVGQIVFVAFSQDETIMGFGFPKELRAALVESDPNKFLMPSQSDLRYNWVSVRLDAVDREELSALVIAAWRMCVPKKVGAAYDLAHQRSRNTKRA